MRMHARYPDWHEGEIRPLDLSCFRAAPGSTVRRVLDLTGVTATVTLKRYGGDKHGEIVIRARTASISPDAAHRLEYWPTAPERRLIAFGTYQAEWDVLRNGRKLKHGPIDLTVLESLSGTATTDPMALIFNIPTNSGLLSVI
jgi:hypothetical protein